MNQTPEITAVLPVFNEEETLPDLFERLTVSLRKITENYEILFVNDGSTDRTLELIRGFAQKDERNKFISFSRNFGHQIALTAGLEHAEGQALIIMDADLQDPPELLADLYEKHKEGYKVVYAKRIARKGEGFFKKKTAQLFYKLLKRITAIDIPLDTGDFRLISKEVANRLNEMKESNKFLRGQIAWLGFSQAYVEFQRDERKYGKTKYTLRKMISLALDGITSFSIFPLQLATLLGFMVSIIAFLLILYVLFAKFVLHSTIAGWTSLMVSIMFIGGVQLICIGIIGEYMGRLTHDVRKRPLYIVEEKKI